ncbi:AAA family ATPase [Brevibacillus humidisoli]|uniref:SbcC/MukB-like Walker B domain-containing protein n=1 Tax=Brevibacillus humidisoli TaxID=2895522 RepID=UPI001E43E3F1|nr:AAA family ATPase [Brevibacillus humidisoli]UFJ39811.1 AAA family ATPase [Brevibacillus humidisoli]
MKPIYLKLAGLHSYRDMQEIDFEKLCEAGLFGIFGPTGSGKSTILDAITLALYGQVVRMGGGTHPHQVLNQLEDRLFVSFTFELGHGDQRRRYTIEREFGLDKKGNRRQPEVRLIERSRTPDEQDRVLESKAMAATAAIEQLIGLTIHDFTRAVVLPQGQFSRFLTLKGSERNEMLQRIFHLEEYGEKLHERVRSLYERNKQELHRLQLELAALGAAGPEALQAATSEWEEATRQEQGLSSEWQRLSEQRRTLEQLREWQTEREQLLAKIGQLEEKQAEIAEVTRQIGRIERSVTLWPRLERLRQLEKEQVELEQQRERQRAEAEAAAAEVHTREERLSEAQGRLRTEEPLLHERKSRMAVALEWERELAALSQEWESGAAEREQLQAEIERISARLSEAEKQTAALEEEWKQVDQEEQALTAITDKRNWLQAVRDVKQTWQSEQQKLEEVKQERAELLRQQQAAEAEVNRQQEAWRQAAALREQTQAALAEAEERANQAASEQELDKLREQLARVKTIGKEWREWTRAREAWETKKADWQRRMQDAAGQVEAAETAWRAADAVRIQRDRERQEAEQARLEWQRANMAYTLRHALREGEPCPVCGSEHHPHRLQTSSTEELEGLMPQEVDHWQRREAEAADRVDKAVHALRKAEEAARQAYEQLQREQAGLRALREQQAPFTEEQAALEGRLRTLQEELAQLDKQWVVSDVDALSVRYKQTEQLLNKLTEERGTLRQQVEKQQQQLAVQRERELEQKGEHDKQAALLERLREAAVAAEARLAKSQSTVDEAKQRLDELRGTLAVEEVDREYAHLGEADERLQHLRQRRQQIETSLKQVQQSRQQDRETYSRLSAQEAALAERLQERSQLREQKRIQWHELTGGEPAASCLEKIERQLEQLYADASQAERVCKEAAVQLQKQQEMLWKTEEALAHLTRQHAEESASIMHEIAAEELDSPAEVERLYQERESLGAYRRQVEEHRTMSAQLHYDEQRLRERLAGRTVTEEEWEKLTAALDEMEQALANSRERAAVARQSLARIEENHQRWMQVDDRLEQLEAEQSRLDDLKKLFEAKAFVQFIAEEKLASIARDASYHLARMTKNRYALEIGAEGEFILRDEASGGMRRPVSTLSGGETFLTSLALALALSVEIQMRGGKLEFFFLDEGFGTLDPELLEVVLDALERLRMDHFTIGLISHVPEMRARMPRRLVITPAEPMGAGSRIALEME